MHINFMCTEKDWKNKQPNINNDYCRGGGRKRMVFIVILYNILYILYFLIFSICSIMHIVLPLYLEQ